MDQTVEAPLHDEFQSEELTHNYQNHNDPNWKWSSSATEQPSPLMKDWKTFCRNIIVPVIMDTVSRFVWLPRF
jgi:hypothetical protein